MNKYIPAIDKVLMATYIPSILMITSLMIEMDIHRMKKRSGIYLYSTGSPCINKKPVSSRGVLFLMNLLPAIVADKEFAQKPIANVTKANNMCQANNLEEQFLNIPSMKGIFITDIMWRDKKSSLFPYDIDKSDQKL